MLFFGAVVLTSWQAGMRGGFVASALSVAALDLFFGHPGQSWRFEFAEDLVDLTAFAGAAWLVCLVQDRWRGTHRKLVIVEEELAIARRIQQRFFPGAAPAMPGLDIAGNCFPASEMSGDFYDYVFLEDGSFIIAVGDVSGHGLGPAMVMVLLRSYLRALALTTSDLSEILTGANRLLCQETDRDWFVTVFLVHVSPGTRLVRRAGAGHEAYLLDASGELTRLKNSGMALGIDADERIGQGAPFEMGAGHVLLVLSDGIVESRNRASELFGLDRVLDTTRRHLRSNAAEIVTAIREAAEEHREGLAPQDDMTIVVVKAAI